MVSGPGLRIRIRIRIGSGFNRVSGSGYGLDRDPYWIRIRIGIQPKMLDPDPDEMNADPQPCSGLKALTYEEKLKELGLTTLEERRQQADMVQVYKIVNGKDMVDSQTWCQLKAHKEHCRPTVTTTLGGQT
jgi:hypothetical protein